MKSAPTSGAESTPASDVPANALSFARHLRAANKSPNTIKAYLDAVGRLDTFLEGRGMPRAVAAIHREHIEAFVEDQLARLKPASAANRYRSLQQFFRWLVDEGEIRESPMARMKPPTIPETPPDVLREDQLKRLLDACAGQARCQRRAQKEMIDGNIGTDHGLRRNPTTRAPWSGSGAWSRLAC